MKIHRYSVFVILCMGLGYFCDNYLEGKVPPTIAGIAESFMKSGFNSKDDGFITIPEAAVPKGDRVHINIPRNASPAGKERAENLIKGLEENKIPYMRLEKVNLNFPAGTDRFLIQRIDVVLLGEVPVVIVGGKIKANPSLEEVLRKYKKEP